MNRDDKLRLFGLSNLAAERELDKVEATLNINFCRSEREQEEEQYYPQFDQPLRNEAIEMSRHYELFYCLEKSIRKLLDDTLVAQHGENWWSKCVPKSVQENAALNMKKELDSGVTLRSEEEIDFTNFGELGEIVKTNWDSFDAIFSSQKAFTKIMTSLNMLRAPIAHCCPLAEDEIVRLRLTVKDWFRLME